jgi:hypothetical protein
VTLQAVVSISLQIYLQLTVEGIIPNMTHIVPILNNPIADRIRYIKLMSQVSTSCSNDYILQ